MYFLWKRTPHGSIRVSCDGLSGFIDRILSDKSRCRSLFLSEGDSASVTLVLSSDKASSKGIEVEERIASIVAPLGFRVQVIWVDRGRAEIEWTEALSALYSSPWTWMVFVAMIVLIVMAGFKGLFWTLFWGTSAWFVSKLAISFLNKRRLGSFSPAVRR